jgi:hypothetical protein
MGDYVHGDQADLRIAHEKHVHENEKDLEAGSTPTSHDQTTSDEDVEVIPARELKRRGVLAKLTAGEEWLDNKMGIETQGIDRIHEEDKKPPSLMNVFWLWWSMTCHVGTIPIGILGPDFGLSLGQSVAAIVVGTMLGALCTAYCGTLGPKVHLLPLQHHAPLTPSSWASAPLPRPGTPSASMAPS